MAVLVVAEHDNRSLRKATLNAVAAAQKLSIYSPSRIPFSGWLYTSRTVLFHSLLNLVMVYCVSVMLELGLT